MAVSDAPTGELMHNLAGSELYMQADASRLDGAVVLCCCTSGMCMLASLELSAVKLDFAPSILGAQAVWAQAQAAALSSG